MLRIQVSIPLYWVVFFALLLLLLLLGETYLGVYVMGLITLFLTLFSTTQKPVIPNHPWYKLAVAVSSLFLIWLGIAWAFSISVPLSLQAVYEWVFVINVFFWFLEVPWDGLHRRFWLLGMLLVGVVMTLLGVLGMFLPQLSYRIPGMNLIYPTYGHNHLGVVLLLLIPMFWSAAQEWPSKLTKFLAVAMNLAPLITFGRVILLLTVVQTFVVHRQFLRRLVWLRWLVGVAAFCMVSMVAFQFFMGWYVDQIGYCPFPAYRQLVCKSWHEERRYWYYLQAYEGFLQSPWTGTGPGTFGVISEKYRQLPAFSTSFVHNDYVQYFVEYGVAGGLLLSFGLVWPLVILFRHTRSQHKTDPLFQGIYWGVSFVAINSWFDFDYHFIGVLTMQVMGLAILSRWGVVDQWPATLSFFDRVVKGWQRWFHFLALGFIGLVCGTYAITNLLLDAGHIQPVVRFFPYFHWQSKIFLENFDDLSPELQQRLRALYWHHGSLLHLPKYLVATSTAEVELFAHVFTINPWSRMEREVYSVLITQGNTRRAEYEVLAANNFFKKRIQRGFQREVIPSDTKTSLAHALMWLADVQFQQGRFAEGVQSMADAQIYEDWIFNDSAYCDSLPVLYRNPDESFLTIIKPLNTIPELFFGKCRPEFARLFVQVYQQQLEYLTCQDDCENLIVKALRFDVGVADDIWENTFPIQIHQLDQTIAKKSVAEALWHWQRAVAVAKVADAALKVEDVGQLDGREQKQQLLGYKKLLTPLVSLLASPEQLQVMDMLNQDERWLYANLEGQILPSEFSPDETSE